MSYYRENIDNPRDRNYIENIEEERLAEDRNLLREEELEEEELQIRDEERLTAMEEFSPINSDILTEDGFIDRRIIENDELYNLEEEELEEDMDIIQEGRDSIW